MNYEIKKIEVKKIQHNLAISMILFDIIVNGTELKIRI